MVQKAGKDGDFAIFVTQRKWPNAVSILAIYGQLNVVYGVFTICL